MQSCSFSVLNMQFRYCRLGCLRKNIISAPPRSTQHDEKPLGLFWQFRPITSNNNNTLYHNLLQDLSIMRKTRDRAERQFTQLLLSDGGQKKKKKKKKNPVGEKSRQEIWVGTMAQTLNSPSYEATNFKCVYLR